MSALAARRWACARLIGSAVVIAVGLGESRTTFVSGTKGRAFRGATLIRRCRTLVTDGRSTSPWSPIGAALYRWRSAPEPTGVRGSRRLAFGPEAPGSIPRRRRSGSHQPPDLWVDVATGTRPVHSPLFVMSAEYGQVASEASSAGGTARLGVLPSVPPAQSEGTDPATDDRQPGDGPDCLGEDDDEHQEQTRDRQDEARHRPGEPLAERCPQSPRSGSPSGDRPSHRLRSRSRASRRRPRMAERRVRPTDRRVGPAVQGRVVEPEPGDPGRSGLRGRRGRRGVAVAAGVALVGGVGVTIGVGVGVAAWRGSAAAGGSGAAASVGSRRRRRGRCRDRGRRRRRRRRRVGSAGA